MRGLIGELGRQFDERGTYRATLALTSEIEITDGVQLVDEWGRGIGERIVVAGLGNSEKILRQFPGGREKKVRIFPVGFSRVACGMQGRGCPAVYDRLIEGLRNRLMRENDGESVFRVESFQLYNTLKQQIRSNVKGFYAGQSILTGGTCVMASQGSAKDKRRRDQMAELIRRGEPFRQIIAGSEHVEREGRVKIRIEPVVSIEMWGIDGSGSGSVDEWEDDVEGKWGYAVRRVIGPLYEVMKVNAEEICLEMVDMYSPSVFPWNC